MIACHNVVLYLRDFLLLVPLKHCILRMNPKSQWIFQISLVTQNKNGLLRIKNNILLAYLMQYRNIERKNHLETQIIFYHFDKCNTFVMQCVIYSILKVFARLHFTFLIINEDEMFSGY